MKWTLTLLIVVVVVTACAQDQPMQESTTTPTGDDQTVVEDSQEVTPTIPPVEQSVEGVTQEELSSHNSKDDCWVVFDGGVYDVTSYVPKHPGGAEKISRFCGTEGFENAFFKEHGTSKEDLFSKVTSYQGVYLG